MAQARPVIKSFEDVERELEGIYSRFGRQDYREPVLRSGRLRGVPSYTLAGLDSDADEAYTIRILGRLDYTGPDRVPRLRPGGITAPFYGTLRHQAYVDGAGAAFHTQVYDRTGVGFGFPLGATFFSQPNFIEGEYQLVCLPGTYRTFGGRSACKPDGATHNNVSEIYAGSMHAATSFTSLVFDFDLATFDGHINVDRVAG